MRKKWLRILTTLELSLSYFRLLISLYFLKSYVKVVKFASSYCMQSYILALNWHVFWSYFPTFRIRKPILNSMKFFRNYRSVWNDINITWTLIMCLIVTSVLLFFFLFKSQHIIHYSRQGVVGRGSLKYFAIFKLMLV